MNTSDFYIKSISPTDEITISEYRTAIQNVEGPRSSLFIPDTAFYLLVKQQIEKLRRPCIECADMVFSELERIVTTLETKVCFSLFFFVFLCIFVFFFVYFFFFLLLIVFFD